VVRYSEVLGVSGDYFGLLMSLKRLLCGSNEKATPGKENLVCSQHLFLRPNPMKRSE
jgi:hypothetical protein